MAKHIWNKNITETTIALFHDITKGLADDSMLGRKPGQLVLLSGRVFDRTAFDGLTKLIRNERTRVDALKAYGVRKQWWSWTKMEKHEHAAKYVYIILVYTDEWRKATARIYKMDERVPYHILTDRMVDDGWDDAVDRMRKLYSGLETMVNRPIIEDGLHNTYGEAWKYRAIGQFPVKNPPVPIDELHWSHDSDKHAE